ncbi:LuxR C-terminal-related transcriptional regulator [Actinoplanes sp. NPDC048796]|uniref:LuxR C-terminal-related transcriptional regulator n=1 Tax=Actinoplanes sp. NPDC048796 TaxID=3155640 RepID=UPI00340011D1
MSTIERERERRRRRRKVLRRVGRPPAGGERTDEIERAFAHGWTERAAALLDHADPGDARVRAIRARFAARPHDAIAELTRAAAGLAAAREPGAALDTLVTAAGLSLITWDGPAASALPAVLAALGDVAGDPRATAVRAVGAGARTVGAGTRTVGAGTRTVGARAVAGEAEGSGPELGLTALAGGDVVRAGDLLTAEAAALRRGGRLGLLVHVLALRAEAAVAAGDWPAAASAATECRVLAERTGQPAWRARATATIALVEAVRGETESSGRHAAEAEILGGPLTATAVRYARGVALLSAERYAEAYTTLSSLMDGPRPVDAAGHLAEAALRCGKRDAMPRIRDPYVRALLDGDEDSFVRARQAARSPWLAARIDLEYGSWLRRQRRVSESRLPVESARHTFEVLGAATWARRAGRELRASGGVPAAGLLSAQELQIARFAADGLSNREIGQRMFLSPRTVGSHLYRIFPKLAVTSRAQLAGRIGLHPGVETGVPSVRRFAAPAKPGSSMA